VNNKTPQGLPIDPITMESIPLNKSIQIATTYQDFPYESLQKPGTDYYCFNQDSLLQWLKNNLTNPFTGLQFKQFEGDDIVEQLKGKKYTWYNGYKSVFSHPPLRRSNAADESPWPEGLRRICLGMMYADYLGGGSI